MAQVKKNMRKVKPRLCATETDRDPVELYKTFIKRRPVQINTPNSSFYLTCIPESRIPPGADIWFYSKPMGENYLGKLMSMAAQECGIEQKTNRSVALKRSGKPELQKIKSTRNYLQILKQIPDQVN